ncbi:hypothetical protein RGU70_16635 [Herbaspirillum sp. RTI4]|uniref:hypothetical protein n=1 Tax=Herbaspirillum sp. RTI4 TaxID=3048640 RepID=UPI002AB4FB2F|nr:hypothetical protein [Herbaspirillum sp. RTI4]MDY7579941.1 hypothetical protein [Herbaspirillum sp. RTI4]MEA9982915.1 hypothetical protein [Herbaspirillum sp. RTI4]
MLQRRLLLVAQRADVSSKTDKSRRRYLRVETLMARDQSPKERQQKQLERKQGRRASYHRILIVSEGSKTEPNYFREIRATY